MLRRLKEGRGWSSEKRYVSKRRKGTSSHYDQGRPRGTLGGMWGLILGDGGDGVTHSDPGDLGRRKSRSNCP